MRNLKGKFTIPRCIRDYVHYFDFYFLDCVPFDIDYIFQDLTILMYKVWGLKRKLYYMIISQVTQLLFAFNLLFEFEAEWGLK